MFTANYVKFIYYLIKKLYAHQTGYKTKTDLSIKLIMTYFLKI